MEQNFTDDQLEAFLKEAGIVVEKNFEKQAAKKQSSVENLLEEIIEQISPQERVSRASLHSHEKASHIFGKGKRQKKWKSFFILWLTAAVLGGFFSATLIGYYWGKRSLTLREPDLLEQIRIDLISIKNEVGLIKEFLSSPMPESIPSDIPEELIEPFTPPDQLEQLAPKELA
jgi:hypothetical protein